MIRREFSVRLADRKDYSDQVTVLVFNVSQGFAQKASLPGSFVFLRRRETGDSVCTAGDRLTGRYLDTPISVLRADEATGTIHLAIRQEGPKSKWLLNRTLPIDDYVVRGPYYSGLLGAEVLRPANVKGKKILFLTKGIGAAPAILTMDRLLTMDEATGRSAQNTALQIRWLADDTKIDRALLEEYAGDPGRGGIPPEYAVLTDPSGEYDIVVVTGSTYFVETMSRQVRKQFPKAALVTSNNAVMCCGEGICGACTEVTEEGRVIRRCKCSER